jgi:transcriptional regulator with XRE-family HTH domain
LVSNQAKLTLAIADKCSKVGTMVKEGLQTLDRLCDRLKTARLRAGLSQAELAKRVGVSSAAVGQWETDDTNPSNANMRTVADVLSVSVEWLASGRGEMTQGAPAKVRAPEGELVDVEKLPPNQRKAIEALLPGPKAEVWLLHTDEIAGAGYRPGDFLIVDVTTRPKAQNFVLAESFKLPVFRQYFPPYLFSVALTNPWPAIIVDNDKTTIRGIVCSRLSF